ncbi:MAG: hypothetical protein AMXMBFR58_28510 [Phycisphaerae bacterium]|nr:hypothetical protein [Phycisphaerales bacterium]
MSERNGPGWKLASWLSSRPPARLAVDGFLILVVAAILDQIRYLLGPVNPSLPTDSPMGRFIYVYQPAAIAYVIASAISTLGWIVVAVACARLVGPAQTAAAK